MEKHTPGPWKTEVITSAHRLGVRVGKDETWEVSASAISDSTANARLIAASPDLLEACKLMLREFGQKFDVKKDFHKMVAFEAARSAIAKAEATK